MSLLTVELSLLAEALLLWLDGDEDEMDEVLEDAAWEPTDLAEG